MNPARRVSPGLFLALAIAAGAAQAAGMGAEDARHLLNRTGFHARLDQIDDFAKLSRREAVERVLGNVRQEARTRPPEWVGDWQSPRRFRQMGAEERKLFQRQLIERGLELKGWWLTEMLTTGSPLTERMTLFWHNHFTSSLQKVRSPVLMYRQNLLLRRHALGSFAELLHAASKDPAMLVYLDSATNRRGQPNENFAREVMELFTLGEGHYAEEDIKEAARAFTGWSVDPESGEFVFRPLAHDDGVKSVLGKSGNWRGEDVLDMLLARPETARFVAAKLWKEFVSPAAASDAEKRELERAARALRESGYSIRAALSELLLAEAFWAPANRGSLIKSPADLVVGTLRQFDVDFPDPLPFALLMRQLGQDLFAPPNVKGWPGGEAWISSQTLLARKQFLERLFRVDEARMTPAAEREPEMAAAQPASQAAGQPALQPFARRFMRAMLDIKFSAHDWFRPFQGREMPATLQTVLLPAAPANEGALAGQGMDMLRALIADPVYQLK
ncbi:MAG: DUF1800 domain-containing protein [Burkholderiales bacterium]